MADITSICRLAWQQSKKASQPDYDDLVEAYRNMLTARAEGAIASGVSDDAPFQTFENAVIEQVAKAPDGLTDVEDITPYKVEPEHPLQHVNDFVAGTGGDVPTATKLTLSPEVAQAEVERLARSARRKAARTEEEDCS